VIARVAALIVPLFLAAYGVALADEVMTDRCSQEVAFPPAYAGQPNEKGTVILKRNAEGSTAWSKPFTVKIASDGHIRWWCHSTTGNAFDPGTWRVTGVNPDGIATCVASVAATVGSDGTAAASLASCEKVFQLGSSAWEGWTPEQSRCGNHSTRIRARLGPDRLLQTECLGN
jgi:hypothetical protein